MKNKPTLLKSLVGERVIYNRTWVSNGNFAIKKKLLRNGDLFSSKRVIKAAFPNVENITYMGDMSMPMVTMINNFREVDENQKIIELRKTDLIFKSSGYPFNNNLVSIFFDKYGYTSGFKTDFIEHFKITSLYSKVLKNCNDVCNVCVNKLDNPDIIVMPVHGLDDILNAQKEFHAWGKR